VDVYTMRTSADSQPDAQPHTDGPDASTDPRTNAGADALEGWWD